MRETPVRSARAAVDARLSEQNEFTTFGAVVSVLQSKTVASWDPLLVGGAGATMEPAVRAGLDPMRANFLRSLDLSPDDAVLEIGSTGGTTTRYLGEQVGTVDCLEQDGERAFVTALRTRDQENVQVFQVGLAEVPVAAVYDVIVVADGLAGLDDANAAVVLRQAALLLAPAGTIVIGAHNGLGVKYLAGAPDPESAVVFDSIEGYPRQSTLRQRNRRQLLDLLRVAGLSPRELLALPDHVMTRALIDSEAVPKEHRSIISDLAITPSPDLVGTRPKLVDETRLWAEAVDGGLASDLANAFVVLATAGAPSALWQKGQIASYHSWSRSAEFTAETVISSDDGRLRVSRHYRHADPVSDPRVFDSTVEFVEGRNLLDVLVDLATSGDVVRDVVAPLVRWRELIEESAFDGGVWLDLHPGNVIVAPDGELVPIDLEFASRAATTDAAVRRGLLIAARKIAVMAHPSVWPTQCETIEDVTHLLGEALGFSADSGWLRQTVAEEAGLQALVAGSRGAGRSDSSWRGELEEVLETALVDMPLGRRVFDDVDRVAEERDKAFARLGDFDKRVAQLEAHEASLQSFVGVLEARAGEAEARVGEFAAELETRTTDLAAQRVSLSWEQEKSARLARHVESLENRLSVDASSSADQTQALRNDVHNRYLKQLELEASTPMRLGRRVEAILDRFAPPSSPRRLRAVRLLRRLRR